ncbi:MAG: 4'-phosphopantetheinyl transferase family protein [Micromonosporaceae bacterium]
MLSRDAVHVWWATLGQAPDSRLHALLDPVERERMAAYRRQPDRDRFLLGASLVRLGCARYLGRDPAELALDRHCDDCGKPHGKVRLREDAGLHFSVSHSGDHVGVAFATGAEVGLDVERIRDIDVAGLSRMVLAPDENAASIVDFFRYWTRKEAAVKATGDGLRTPLSGLTVSAADQQPAVLAWPERAAALARIRLYDLADRPGHRAALAVLDPVPREITERDAAGLLTAG